MKNQIKMSQPNEKNQANNKQPDKPGNNKKTVSWWLRLLTGIADIVSKFLPKK